MKHKIKIGKHTLRIDIGFILILLWMCALSCLALYTSFNLISIGSGTRYLVMQIIWYIVGFTTMGIIGYFHNRVLYRYMRPAYNFLMGCLVYLFLSMVCSRLLHFNLPLAPTLNGAVSWFQIPFISSFQPSEFLKIVLIVMTAQTITSFQKKHKNPTMHDDLHMLWEIGKVVLPPLVLIFLQPDTGVCIIIFVTILVMLMCSGIRKQYIWILLGLAVLAIGGFFYLYFFQEDFLHSFVSSYRLQRIDAWLDPESNIRGSSNQLYTVLLSLGSSGLTGYGLQPNIIAIPEAHTDFIFAAFGQSFGLIGTTVIVLSCFGLDLYLCKIAYNMRNRTDRLIVIGVIGMLFYQQIQNLGMIVGLLPITGITLPLISYGGSSILSYFIAFGFISNSSPQARKKGIRIGKLKKRTSANKGSSNV